MADSRPAAAGVPPEMLKSSAAGIIAMMAPLVFGPTATSGCGSTSQEKLLVGSSR